MVDVIAIATNHTEHSVYTTFMNFVGTFLRRQVRDYSEPSEEYQMGQDVVDKFVNSFSDDEEEF